ncbi:hypothetical protein SDC9_32036 [bioreactor metagenome]|uniref:Uncharacterized protein n=1 Tax=bioreactor metagenome TaxID=1076179 RepID=A0A644V3Z9_9ZZZZ
MERPVPLVHGLDLHDDFVRDLHPVGHRLSFRRSGARLSGFEPFRTAGQREAHREIEERNEAIDPERLERCVVERVGGAHQLLETEDRGQRRRLDELDEKTDRGPERDAEGLRQDHQAQLLPPGQAKACAGIPLAFGQRLDAAAPDLGEIGRGVDRQPERRRRPGLDAQAELRQAEEDQEQQQQQRRALEDLDIEIGHAAQPPSRRDPREQDRQPDDHPADEGHRREQQRPARREQQVAQQVPQGEFDHDSPGPR